MIAITKKINFNHTRFDMITVELKKSEKPLYEQIYEKIKEEIIIGNIKEGERLPSKRALAAHLEVSVSTVENAYFQLLSEGYIYTLEKSGYFVDRVEFPEKEDKGELNLQTKTHESIEIKRDYKIDLSSNGAFVSLFPFSVFSKITRNILSSENETLLSRSGNRGLLVFRKEIAKHLLEFRGMVVSPEQIVVGSGTEYLYSLLIALLGKEKLYAIEDPCYTKISNTYSVCGARTCAIPMTESGIDVEELQRSLAQVAHISPNHHYPTGIVTSVGRRTELLRWAAEKDGYIIEDDYDSEFRFVGRPIPTMQSVDSFGRVIYMNTFTKSIAPSFRVGYMVLPKELSEKFNQRFSFYSCPVSTLDQLILYKFMQEGHFEIHINRMKKYYKLKRERVISLFKNSRYSRHYDIKEDISGTHFFLILKTSLSDVSIKRAAERLCIKLHCMSDFAINDKEKYSRTILVNYSALDEDKLRALL